MGLGLSIEREGGPYLLRTEFHAGDADDAIEKEKDISLVVSSKQPAEVKESIILLARCLNK